MIFNFERLIRKYGVQGASIEVAGESGWVDGEYVEQPPQQVPLQCAIVPMATRTVYDSGGRYTTADRTMYTQQQLPLQSIVTYRDATYSVEEISDYTEYADFYTYQLKKQVVK